MVWDLKGVATILTTTKKEVCRQSAPIFILVHGFDTWDYCRDTCFKIQRSNMVSSTTTEEALFYFKAIVDLYTDYKYDIYQTCFKQRGSGIGRSIEGTM